MSRLATKRTAQGLVDLAGGNHRRYIPGTLRLIRGGYMEWDEACRPGGCCVHTRSSLTPSGLIDTDGQDVAP